MRRLAAGLIPLIILSGCATRDPVVKGQPTRELSTPYTLKTGGQTPPLQRGLTVEHADLWFNFDFKRQVLYGTTELTLNSERRKRTLSVDLDTRFEVEGVWLNGKQVPPGNVKNPDGQLLITPQQAIQFPLSVKIKYVGRPRKPVNAPWDGGVMWNTTDDGEPWLATAVQGEGCDLFWPCIDQPFGEPQSMDIHITVPKNLVAASNGKLVDVAEQESAHTYHWKTSTPTNTYGVALNIAPYKTLTSQYRSMYGNRFPITYYYLASDDNEKAQAQGLFDELPAMLAFFEKLIGPYPFADDKVGVVQTPHKGMEHQTINAYGNNYEKDEYGFDWLMQHEFAHEWFGNQLTNKDWDDMWLHEGLGTYMQPLYAQYLHGELAYMAYLNKIRKPLINDVPIVSGQTRSEEQVYEDGPGLDIYYKGAWVMHTLRQLIGDGHFFAAVTQAVYGRPDPEPGNFSPVYLNTQDFIDIVNQQTGQDYRWFFDVYLYHASLPEVISQRSRNQLRLEWQTEGDLPFPMPLDVSVNGNITTLDMRQPQTITVSPKDVVIIDPLSKVLRYDQRYEDLKDYEQTQKENKKK